MESIQWIKNRLPPSQDLYLSLMSEEQIQKAWGFHRSFPQYAPTPLQNLPAMAQTLGLKEIHVKDESFRFGLNSFKVLGGSFAMARYIAQKLGRDVSSLPYEALTSKNLRQELGQITFYTATDGNHGRGVAWAASRLQQKSVVFMPAGSSLVRLENIRKEGADASIEEHNYDECVRMAAAAAKENGGVLLQDTAWKGYEEIPSWIMQGYGTLAKEAAEQLQKPPTHIFIQAGVGSLAAAVQGFFANLYPENPPLMVTVEAGAANCLYQSAAAGDGRIRTVGGDLHTIMAGLACGEPSSIGWDILRNHSNFFVSCPDWVSARGMRMLAAPCNGDPQIISGESGAVSFGLVATVMLDKKYRELREALRLDKNSVVLAFSTEGDTDPANYRDIVWGGRYPYLPE